MPNYIQYKKMMAVLDYDDSDIESWITVNGNHIPIKKGQTKEEAVKSFVERKRKVANEIVDRVHGHSVGGWIGSQKEYKDLFYRNENGKTKSNEEMHKFADRVETEVRMARKTPQFKKSVMSAHSIAMGDLQKEMPESMKKTFTPERHKELMEKKFKDKDTDVIFGNWNYTDQYKKEFFNDEGNWLDDEAEKRYDYIKKVENKFDEIYEARNKEAMTHAANKIIKEEEEKNIGMPTKPRPWFGSEKKTETAPKESESDLKKWDKEVTKYHDEEEKAEAEFKKMRSSFGDHYDKLYNSQYLDDKYNYLVGEYEKKMEDPKFQQSVRKFVQARGDALTSDREIKAYMLALQDQEKAAQAPKAKNPDSPLVSAVAKALNKSPAEAESEIEGAAQYISDLMKSNDLRNGDVEETLRGLGVEPDYAEEFMQWASSPKKKQRKPRTKRSKPDNMVYQDKKHPNVFYVDEKAWNSPANDPWYGLYN